MQTGALVSKETVGKKKPLDLSTDRVDKVNSCTVKKGLMRETKLRSDEGLTLEASAFNFFTVANLPYQLN